LIIEIGIATKICGMIVKKVSKVFDKLLSV